MLVIIYKSVKNLETESAVPGNPGLSGDGTPLLLPSPCVPSHPYPQGGSESVIHHVVQRSYQPSDLSRSPLVSPRIGTDHPAPGEPLNLLPIPQDTTVSTLVGFQNGTDRVAGHAILPSSNLPMPAGTPGPSLTLPTASLRVPVSDPSPTLARVLPRPAPHRFPHYRNRK